MNFQRELVYLTCSHYDISHYNSITRRPKHPGAQCLTCDVRPHSKDNEVLKFRWQKALQWFYRENFAREASAYVQTYVSHEPLFKPRPIHCAMHHQWLHKLCHMIHSMREASAIPMKGIAI